MTITDKPVDLPSGNALDDIPEDLLGKPPANLHLGALVLPDGDFITISKSRTLAAALLAAANAAEQAG